MRKRRTNNVTRGVEWVRACWGGGGDNAYADRQARFSQPNVSGKKRKSGAASRYRSSFTTAEGRFEREKEKLNPKMGERRGKTEETNIRMNNEDGEGGRKI